MFTYYKNTIKFLLCNVVSDNIYSYNNVVDFVTIGIML